MRIVRPFAHREDAIEEVRRLNALGVKGILSYLPVRKDDAPSVRRETKEYLGLLDAIRRAKIDAQVSLKLHQFGLYGSKGLAEREVTKVIKHAHALKNLVWVDTELCETIADTVAIFKDEFHRYPGNVGICVQAYHARSESDMHDLLKHPVRMRLVKGFYKEREVRNWSDVTKTYANLMEYLLLHSRHPCIATHDPLMIARAKRLIRKHGISGAAFEFFYGVCNDRAIKLAREGFNVRMYVPYGHCVSFLLHGLTTFDNYRQAQRMLSLKKIR